MRFFCFSESLDSTPLSSYDFPYSFVPDFVIGTSNDYNPFLLYFSQTMPSLPMATLSSSNFPFIKKDFCNCICDVRARNLGWLGRKRKKRKKNTCLQWIFSTFYRRFDLSGDLFDSLRRPKTSYFYLFVIYHGYITMDIFVIYWNEIFWLGFTRRLHGKKVLFYQQNHLL